MAHLRNGEVEVDRASNESKLGPSGTRKRAATSCYLLVGGSSNTYKVTISTAGGHFCVDHAGAPCKGNLHGKGQKYGSVHNRDRNDARQWCKHVAAALADGEKIAEAQEITAAAFGAPKVKPVAPKAVEAKPAPVVADAKVRLAELEVEAAKLRASVEIGDKVAALVAEYGREAVAEAIKAA